MRESNTGAFRYLPRNSSACDVHWAPAVAACCCGPTFWVPGDDLLINQARRTYASGLTYGNQVQAEIDWCISGAAPVD